MLDKAGGSNNYLKYADKKDRARALITRRNVAKIKSTIEYNPSLKQPDLTKFNDI